MTVDATVHTPALTRMVVALVQARWSRFVVLFECSWRWE